MKKYIREIIILIIQLIMFYVTPALAQPDYAMGMVALLILVTLLLSIVIGIISNEKIKYLYPITISIMFIPSIFIYYNESALIHIIWYLIVAIIGLIIGIIIRKILNKN